MSGPTGLRAADLPGGCPPSTAVAAGISTGLDLAGQRAVVTRPARASRPPSRTTTYLEG